MHIGFENVHHFNIKLPSWFLGPLTMKLRTIVTFAEEAYRVSNKICSSALESPVNCYQYSIEANNNSVCVCVCARVLIAQSGSFSTIHLIMSFLKLYGW